MTSLSSRSAVASLLVMLSCRLHLPSVLAFPMPLATSGSKIATGQNRPGDGGNDRGDAFRALPISSTITSTALPVSICTTETGVGIDEEFVPFPHREIEGPEVVQLCMDSLAENNMPYNNAGLEVCWNFSSDRCRASQGGSFENFVEFASNPVFQSLMSAAQWSTKSVGPIIPGTPTRGAMQTVLVTVTSAEEGLEPRDFLWTLLQERRPPRQGCWLVHECIWTKLAYQQTL